jgi:DNA polymerase-3 subunit delta
MAVYKRQDIPDILNKAAHGDTPQVYLLHGERFLCRNAAEELLDRLLPGTASTLEQRANRVHEIDGDQEDFSRTLNLLRTYSLFPGRQVIRVTDTKLFYAKGAAKTLWDKVCKAYNSKELSSAGRYLAQFLEVAGMSAADGGAEEITVLSPPQWRDLFGFAKPADNLDWLQEIINHLQQTEGQTGTEIEKSPAAAERFMRAFAAGIPAANILILLAEVIDKRNSFYKFIKDHGVVLDLSVASGGGKAARNDQEAITKDLLQKTLVEFGKKIAPRALELLLDRVGFHPVAVVRETEKLAIYTGDAATITADDVNAVIGRTREEALYELTEAVTGQRLYEALIILGRLLGNNIHALAILATLRNHLKKMLLIRAAQHLSQPYFEPGMSFPVFQKKYLPALKQGRDDWSMLWAGHPYGLYLLFRQTVRFGGARLQNSLQEVLAAEYRLKGSTIPARLILENLLFKLLGVDTVEGQGA